MPRVDVDIAPAARQAVLDAIQVGYALADAAAQHWDPIPMGVVLADWEDAVIALQREVLR